MNDAIYEWQLHSLASTAPQQRPLCSEAFLEEPSTQALEALFDLSRLAVTVPAGEVSYDAAIKSVEKLGKVLSLDASDEGYAAVYLALRSQVCTRPPARRRPGCM